ncbi:hypothetical protein AB0J80_37925 [Actinoplanes sp. NPDC049548]|uniref:hypothetical protein n=1 Tax=Actinoplanes sp. NPDC049548 TaxID=3155152 RepID=UPI00344A79B7
MFNPRVPGPARRIAFTVAGLLVLTTAATAVAAPFPAMAMATTPTAVTAESAAVAAPASDRHAAFGTLVQVDAGRTVTQMTAVVPAEAAPSSTPTAPVPAPTAYPTGVPTAPLPTYDPEPQPTDDPPPTDLTLEHRYRYSYQVKVCPVLDRVAVAKALRVRSVRVYTAEGTVPGSCLLVNKLKDPTAQWSVTVQPTDSPWVTMDSSHGKVLRVAGFKGVVRKLRSDSDVLNLLATRGKYSVYVEVVTRGAIPLAAACAQAGKYLAWLVKTKPAHPKFPEGTPLPY